MEMKKVLVVTIGMLFWVNGWAGGVTVLDPAYQVEEYVSYASTSGWVTGMTFDPEGNLYTVYRTTGNVCRIESDKNVTLNWVSNIVRPRQIIWVDDSNYGNYFYLTDPGEDKLWKITATGNKTTFAYPGSDTCSLAFDTTNNYGRNIFVGTTADDRIYRVLPNGQVQVFSNFFYGTSGGIWGIDFDPGTDFGGKMYVGYGGDVPQKSGLFQMDASGNPTRFAPSLVYCDTIGFSPVGGIFGSDLFVNGKLQIDGPTNLFRVDAAGNATLFVEPGLPFVFGPDGAMYVHEWSNGISTISRISLVPEPATLTLLTIGVLGLRRKKKI